MAFVFKVDSTDLSVHLRVNQGDGLDPHHGGDFIEPEWANNAAGEGDSLLSIRAGNREQAWPVALNPAKAGYASTKDGLNQLVRDVNNALANAQTIEWRDDGATNSTFYDVAFARFEPAYDFRRSQKLWAFGMIRAWTGPYGHSGTSRILATAAATGPVAVIPVPSAIIGDAPALPVVKVTAGGADVTGGRVIGVAALPHASYAAAIPVASLADLSDGATVMGASGAVGSQFLRVMHDTVGYRAFSIPLSIPSIYAGRRHRVMLTAKSLADGGYSLNVVDPAGNVGPTAVATAFRDWQFVDLGAVSIPSTVPTITRLPVIAGLNRADPSAIRAAPSAYLGIDEAYLFPDDTTSVTLDGNGLQLLGDDDFPDIGTPSGAALFGQSALLGLTWGGEFIGATPQRSPYAVYQATPAVGVGIAVLEHDAARDLHGRIRFAMNTLGASGNSVRVGKVGALPTITPFVYAEVQFATQAWLNIRSRPHAVNASLLASVGLAASSLLIDTAYELDFTSKGTQITAGLRCAVSSAPVVNTLGSSFDRLTLTSGAVDGAQAGQLLIGIVTPTSGLSPVITAAHAEQMSAPSVAQPYDTNVLDAVGKQVYRSASGRDITGFLGAGQRGELPHLSPSTPAIAVIEAPRQPGLMADVMSVEIRVRERFTYAR